MLSPGRARLPLLLLALMAWTVQAQHPTLDTAHQTCQSCHTPHHSVAGAAPLQVAITDATCLACHTPTTAVAPKVAAAQLAIAAEKGRRVGLPDARERTLPIPPGGSSHGIRRPGTPASKYTRTVGTGTRRKVLRMGCTSCHDPHGKQPKKLTALVFDARGQLQDGVKPVYAAQICYGCHAGPEAAPLEHSDSDVGSFFSPGKGSSHVIGQAASNRPDLPSLWTTPFKGHLDCTSCHSNPDATGLRGPHVSRFPTLLKGAYGSEREAAFLGGRPNELCYSCHDQRSIETNRSFPLHREHILGFTGGPRPKPELPMGFRAVREAQPGRSRFSFVGLGDPTPCATCHNPHGSKKYPSLISFDPEVVTRSSVGGVDFYRSGLGHGTCTLSCHGYDHVQTRY